MLDPGVWSWEAASCRFEAEMGQENCFVCIVLAIQEALF